MVRLKELCLILLTAVTALVDFAVGGLTVYPHAQQISASDKYRIYVTQNQVKYQSFTYINHANHRAQEKQYVYPHRTVSWTSFAFTGNPVAVEVQTQTDFQNCIVRPRHYGYHCNRVRPKTAQFIVTSNTRMMSVEYDYDFGSNQSDIVDKLMIFADPPETNAPKANSSGVLYYPTGITDLGEQKHLDASVREVYLAPGAYVHGGFITTGHQPIKIHGRGILSGEKYKLHDSRFSYSIVQMDKGSHHLVEGLVIVDPPGFFIRALNGDRNTVRNVKTVGAWTYNTDGVSVGNYGLVEDSFFMVNDDAIKIYKNNTVVRNCVVWQSHNGAVFQTGWWDRHIHYVRISDIDVIHTDWCAFQVNNCYLSNNNGVLDQTGDIKQIRAYDVEFRNIRIEGNVARLFNFIVQEGAVGYVSKFSFIDWTVEKLSQTRIHNQITGSSSAHINKWHFENFKIGGKCISHANEANLVLDHHTVFLTSFHCPGTPAIG